ncbi:MAG: galactokinase [Acidobacteria bacterium]|nr:galactokinase [Acidobacteriota bacterium]
MKEKILAAFEKIYRHKPTLIVRAPGRVNLIGEHTDYNNGYVLPMAIGNEVMIAASPRIDDQVNLVALDKGNEEVKFSLFDIRPDSLGAWNNYPRSIIALIKRNRHSFPGFNAVIGGNIPIGAGLSSSAALLVATGILVEALGGLKLDKIELAKLCQKGENLFCGVESGIMDHFVIALAKANHALLIDCFTLAYEYILLPENAAILICNTMKSRELSNSAYNERKAECNKMLVELGKIHKKSYNSFRDVSLIELAQAEKQLPFYLFKRAKHVISENARVLAAVEAAARDDLAGLGILMNESHESLRSLYEVSSIELDTMVKIARQQKGVFGARLTGAGFGGCTVNLVEKQSAQTIAETIKEQYYKQTGVKAEVYLATPCAGASLVAMG